MRIYPDFPPHRRQDPRCRSEAIIYDQLSQCELPGHGLYELNPGPETVEVDFALWIEDPAGPHRPASQGGHYTVENTVWRLRLPAGADLVPCPLTQTWDGAIGIRDALTRSRTPCGASACPPAPTWCPAP